MRSKLSDPYNDISESGATLIFLIVVMVVLALLGAAVFSLIATTSLNQAEAQKSSKAYYLAESCLRIAASEYKAATASNKNSMLINLNQVTFNMPNQQGACFVKIYPYWVYSTSARTYGVGETSISLYLPGEVPLIEENGTVSISLNFPLNVSAKLKKKGSSSEVYEFSSASFGSFNGTFGTPVTFTLKTALTSAVTIASGDEFYIGNTYTAAGTLPLTINAGDSLILNINVNDTSDLTANMFPPVKGSIFLDMTGIPQLTYDQRVINTSVTPHTMTLTNIRGAVASTVFPIVISSNPSVYIGKSMGMRSTSQYGN